MLVTSHVVMMDGHIVALLSFRELCLQVLSSLMVHFFALSVAWITSEELSVLKAVLNELHASMPSETMLAELHSTLHHHLTGTAWFLASSVWDIVFKQT